MDNCLNGDKCLLTQNPRYEFVEDENGLLIFDENVESIYRTNKVGKAIIKAFNEPKNFKEAVDFILTIFEDVVLEELEQYIMHLIEERIIVPSQ